MKNTGVGTPGYRAPEALEITLLQSKNSEGNIITHKLDYSIDLWSMGCIFYYLITGKMAFSPNMLMDNINAKY